MKRPTILNREFKHPTDGWYHIEPKGNHPNSEAGVIQVIDADACESIVNRFNAAADAGTLSHGHEMLIDHEHFKHDEEKETRAFGWLTQLQNRADGYYGQIRWTKTGKESVDGGDYRFFSTEYPPEECEIVKNKAVKSGKFLRPMELSGLTLTNMPNNKGGKPITNSSRQIAASSTAGEQADIQNRKRQSMKQIASRLGLSADASEEAILGELTKILNRAETAEGQIAPLTTELATLKNRVATMENESADSILDAHGIKEDDKDRAAFKAGLIHNRETGIAFLKRMGKSATEKKPLTNRGEAKTPGDAAESTAGDEQSTAAKITNRAKELQGNSKRTFNDCWNQARQEVDAAK